MSQIDLTKAPKMMITPLIKGTAYAIGVSLIAFLTWMTTTTLRTEKDVTVLQNNLVQHEEAYKREFIVIHDSLERVQTNIMELRKDIENVFIAREGRHGS